MFWKALYTKMLTFEMRAPHRDGGEAIPASSQQHSVEAFVRCEKAFEGLCYMTRLYLNCNRFFILQVLITRIVFFYVFKYDIIYHFYIFYILYFTFILYFIYFYILFLPVSKITK